MEGVVRPLSPKGHCHGPVKSKPSQPSPRAPLGADWSLRWAVPMLALPLFSLLMYRAEGRGQREDADGQLTISNISRHTVNKQKSLSPRTYILVQKEDNKRTHNLKSTRKKNQVMWGIGSDREVNTEARRKVFGYRLRKCHSRDPNEIWILS